MNEFELIRTYFQQPRLAFNTPYVLKGIGDDCATLSIPDDLHLHVSLDTLVSDVHFPAQARGYDIATRALGVTLSDLAAMGAKPIGFTLGITLPDLDEAWLASFCSGLAHLAQKYECPLIGGDTTKGPVLVISIQVHGVTAKNQFLRRSGAKIGDKVYVSGPLGDAAGALSLVLDKPSQVEGLAQAYYLPEPKIGLGLSLASYASSALDISDGLLQDLNHICVASGVGMSINSQQIPLSDALITLVGKERALALALTGGDDYQLAYTAAHCDQGICIGEVIKGQSVWVDDEPADPRGYQHFG